MKVSFLDLKLQYQTIKGEVDRAISEVLESSAFSGGPFVERFERAFAAAHGAKYCVGVNNGTSALHIALWALGVKPGDEVIVPANTFIATAEAVSLCGAKPIFVDCDPETYNLDPAKAENAITPRTKAIIPVHMFGQSADMDDILKLAARHNLQVLEDCAQAHLSVYKDRRVGTFGVAGCFSFYPGKNLGAYGEAGAVLTNNEDLYWKMMALRDHGALKKYHHDLVGHNYRMEGIQGAVLEVKLRHLEEWTRRRRACASRYHEALCGIPGLTIPAEMPQRMHVYHLYVIRVKDRDQLAAYLKEHGVQTGIHYPIPCHRQKAYASLGYAEGTLPTAESYASEILSLPMHEGLTDQEVDYVAKRVREFY